MRPSPIAAASDKQTAKTIFGRLRSVVQKGRETVAVWRQRNAYRTALATMGERELRDIGLSAHDADRESMRPFWLGPVRHD